MDRNSPSKGFVDRVGEDLNDGVPAPLRALGFEGGMLNGSRIFESGGFSGLKRECWSNSCKKQNLNHCLRRVNYIRNSTKKIRFCLKLFRKPNLYHLKLPKGLSTKDFNEKKQAIAEALNSEVEFSYDNGKILMKVTRDLLKKS